MCIYVEILYRHIRHGSGIWINYRLLPVEIRRRSVNTVPIQQSKGRPAIFLRYCKEVVLLSSQRPLQVSWQRHSTAQSTGVVQDWCSLSSINIRQNTPNWYCLSVVMSVVFIHCTNTQSDNILLSVGMDSLGKLSDCACTGILDYGEQTLKVDDDDDAWIFFINCFVCTSVTYISNYSFFPAV